MTKGISWKILEGREQNLYNIPWTSTLNRNMRKNMKIPRKKENTEQPKLN
jgi:hypothetical protein